MKNNHISGGQKVYPTEIKNVLFGLEQVQEAAIIEALPRNATGKVLKFELRKTIPDRLGSNQSDFGTSSADF